MRMFYKEYVKRKNVFYKMRDISEARGTKTMVRCECSKKFKVHTDDTLVCVECGQVIDREMAVDLDINQYKFYNSNTCLFVDKNEDNETVATISMAMITASRASHSLYPNIGELAVSLKVRLNITKKTALLYMKKIRIDDESWDRVKLRVPYVNFTQPANQYLPEYMDIKLPKELVCDLLKLMEVDISTLLGVMDNIGIYELAWLNRIRDFKEATRQRYIMETLTNHTIINKIKDNNEDFLFYRKNLNRVKRHIASGYKPRNYDENIFKALCNANDVDKKDIPKTYEKYYYMNPVALKVAKFHHLLFKNRDIRVNAIMAVNENHYLDSHVRNEEDMRKISLEIFKNEINMYQKIKNNSDYSNFYDTARVIKEIRDNGIKFKTKGNLYDLHDKASRKLRYVNAPDVTFENTKDIKDEKHGELTFVYAKTPRELIHIGEVSDTCVGSYYSDCIRGNTKIIYIKKEEELVGILEVSSYYHAKNNLCQAKGYQNSLLSLKVQRIVSDFCLYHGYLIRTNDIRNSLREKYNKEIIEVRRNMEDYQDFNQSETAPFIGHEFQAIQNVGAPF